MKRQVATYSQHFLRNPRFIAELIGHSNVRRNDLVLDIGAGSGAITAVLARRTRHVLAYEIEPTALEKLRRNMQRYANVEVIAQDFLQALLPGEPYKVFANIPFHLSSSIVRKLTSTDEAHMPRSVYLIVQKQFAQKLVPSSRHFTSQLGAQIAPWWQARIRRPLRRADFTPWRGTTRTKTADRAAFTFPRVQKIPTLCGRMLRLAKSLCCRTAR